MDRAVVAVIRHGHRAVRTARTTWQRGGPLLPAVLKGVIFGLLLLYVQGSSFAAWPVVLFCLCALVFYMQPVFKTFAFGTSLIILTSIALLLTSRFTIALPSGVVYANALGQLIFAAVFGFLFFVLLGLKNVLVLHRHRWYVLLFTSLLYGISLLFFAGLRSEHVLLYALLLFVLTYLVLREYFFFELQSRGRLLTVVVSVTALMTIEIAWALSLLPLGLSQNASILTLFILMTATSTQRYIAGTLSGRFIRLSLLLFAILTATIFLLARFRL